MLLFFLAWELELLPVYLLLAIWGGKKRQYERNQLSAQPHPRLEQFPRARPGRLPALSSPNTFSLPAGHLEL
jgi:hypothetical protein